MEMNKNLQSCLKFSNISNFLNKNYEYIIGETILTRLNDFNKITETASLILDVKVIDSLKIRILDQISDATFDIMNFYDEKHYARIFNNFEFYKSINTFNITDCLVLLKVLNLTNNKSEIIILPEYLLNSKLLNYLPVSPLTEKSNLGLLIEYILLKKSNDEFNE